MSSGPVRPKVLAMAQKPSNEEASAAAFVAELEAKRPEGGRVRGTALIFVAVFSGFARGDLVMFQQMGFGVAVALLLDATVVRLVLVPAAMQLLGDRNWYLPTWLRWLPDVHVEGAERGPLTGLEPAPGRS
jgi:uncharacterized membrane protein YdfJ with MMPL/SSD domain